MKDQDERSNFYSSLPRNVGLPLCHATREPLVAWLSRKKKKRVDLKTARYRLVDIRKFARAEIARAW